MSTEAGTVHLFGVVRDLDCRDLAEVQRRVVAPVLTALLRPEELGSVSVVVPASGPPPAGWPRVPDQEHYEVRAIILARDEELDVLVGSVSDEPWDAQEAADWFYDRLTEEIPETCFAWGERREGTFDVPGPAGG